MQAKSRWMLVAMLVTSAIALLNAWTGSRALGLLIAGPLLAAVSLDAQRTAIIGLYALGLAVLLGIPDGSVGTTEHLLGCMVVATGAALGALLAHRRIQQERLLLRVTRIAEVAQQTILRPIAPRMGRVAGRDDRQAIGAVRVLAHRGLRRLARRVEAAGLARGVTR
jgi:phosphoserine phosphatase RsbU/P